MEQFLEIILNLDKELRSCRLKDLKQWLASKSAQFVYFLFVLVCSKFSTWHKFN